MNSGGGDRSSIHSSFSELEGGLNNDPHHPLIQQVKNNCGLQDDNQARMYTLQATVQLSIKFSATSHIFLLAHSEKLVISKFRLVYNNSRVNAAVNRLRRWNP
jgi:hypothetical protein